MSRSTSFKMTGPNPSPPPYLGRIIRVAEETVNLPNLQVVRLDVVRHPGASAVVPLKEDGSVVLIHQFRHAAGGYLYEVPAGTLAPGESPEACAMREVEEETGYRAGRLERMGGIVTAPGFCDEQIHLYLATGLERSRQSLDQDEILTVIEMSLEEAMARIYDNTIRDAKSIAALVLAHEKVRGNNRKASGRGSTTDPG
jgi:ADP-ribose pyrophosphatase